MICTVQVRCQIRDLRRWYDSTFKVAAQIDKFDQPDSNYFYCLSKEDQTGNILVMWKQSMKVQMV